MTFALVPSRHIRHCAAAPLHEPSGGSSPLELLVSTTKHLSAWTLRTTPFVWEKPEQLLVSQAGAPEVVAGALGDEALVLGALEVDPVVRVPVVLGWGLVADVDPELLVRVVGAPLGTAP